MSNYRIQKVRRKWQLSSSNGLYIRRFKYKFVARVYKFFIEIFGY